MQAAVLHGPRDLRVEERPVPEPGPRDVLVEVSHCGICGTDLHMVVEGWGTPGTVGGHEWSGRVVAVGSEVSRVDVGQRVVCGSPLGCGDCPLCRDRRPSLCENRAVAGLGGGDGAFAEYTVADEQTLVRVPGGLGLREAALAEPLAVALHAITQSGAKPGHRVLVTGAGPIGTLVIAGLRARGITDIVVSEPVIERQRLAQKLGADVVTPDSLEVFSIAEPSRLVDAPFDAAIECSGKAVAMEAALCQLGRRGTLVLVGTGLDAPAFDPNRLLLNELHVTGAFEYDPGGVDEAVALLTDGKIPTDVLIEPDEVPLSNLLQAMEDLAAGKITGKVLVTPARPGQADRPTATGSES